MHKNVKSKMRKTAALLRHPLLSGHIPETVRYNSEALPEMLERHGSIYLKPDTGSQGSKVLRIRKISKLFCRLADNYYSKPVMLSQLPAELEAITAGRKYLVQQAVELATFRGCPFDVRMVMQKPYDTWQLTLTAAKVAQNKDAVVTNVAKGARDYPLAEILQKYDQKQDALTALQELVDLSHQIAHFLGSIFPFRVIGLDLALDKKGKVWFIEANTRPQCKRCQMVNDAAAIEKYLKAKQIILEAGC